MSEAETGSAAKPKAELELLGGCARMEESPQKKQLVRRLAIAFGISISGFVGCVIALFLFGEHHGWIESQRVHPTPNPVYYAGALELVHYASSWIIPLFGVLFLLIAMIIWLLWRDSKRFA